VVSWKSAAEFCFQVRRSALAAATQFSRLSPGRAELQLSHHENASGQMEHQQTHAETGHFGLRRQSGSGDGAFGRAVGFVISKRLVRAKSGVALRLPSQSMTRWRKTGLPPGRAELQWNQP
jgi:hypothetical protein